MSIECCRKSPSSWPEDLRDRQCQLDAHSGWTHYFTEEVGNYDIPDEHIGIAYVKVGPSRIYAWRDKPTAVVINEEEELPWSVKDWSYEAGDPEITQA